MLIDAGVLLRDEDWQRLSQFVELVRVERDEPYSEDELIAALDGYSGLIRLGGLIPALPRQVFTALPE